MCLSILILLAQVADKTNRLKKKNLFVLKRNGLLQKVFLRDCSSVCVGLKLLKAAASILTVCSSH